MLFIDADGKDICIVNVTAFDASGREVPVADNMIRFELSGDGRIIGIGNGNPSAHRLDVDLTDHYERRLFNGKGQRKGIVEGICYGIYVTLFYFFVTCFEQFIIYPIPYFVVWIWIAAGLVQSVIMGIIAALVYRSKAVTNPAAAAS